jgi:hypothetical protein
MSTIQNIQKLENHLNTEQLTKLEKAAERHAAQSNIVFKIHSVEDNAIEVETIQAETPSGKYASEATLIKRTEDLFRKSLPNYNIKVSTETFLPSPASLVNASWIDKKMKKKGVRIKQIAFETGIDRESISDWVTGKRSMSQIVKAMFYFYLSS